MNKRHYEHTLPNIRGSLSNTYVFIGIKTGFIIMVQPVSLFLILNLPLLWENTL